MCFQLIMLKWPEIRYINLGFHFISVSTNGLEDIPVCEISPLVSYAGEVRKIFINFRVVTLTMFRCLEGKVKCFLGICF